MTPLEWVDASSPPHTHRSLLLWGALVAFALEATLLTAVGWKEHWLAHPQQIEEQENIPFIEAEIFQIPSQAYLIEEKKHLPTQTPREASLSLTPGKAGKQTQALPPSEEKNQTQSGPKITLTHGPVAIYAPSPTIPTYLQDNELNTSILIDFFVNAQGLATSRLVGSSGSEELDAIALKTTAQWQFRPAEEQGKAIAAKVRLRIVFEVK